MDNHIADSSLASLGCQKDEEELAKEDAKNEKKRKKAEKRAKSKGVGKKIGEGFAIVGMGILSSLDVILDAVGQLADNN